MGDSNNRAAALGRLLGAAQQAFFEVWPAATSHLRGTSAAQRFEAVVAQLILGLAEEYAGRYALPVAALRMSRLAQLARAFVAIPPLEALAYRRSYASALQAAWDEVTDSRPASSRVGDIGAVYESLLAIPSKARLDDLGAEPTRKPSGSYYTPPAIAAQVADAALALHFEQTPGPILDTKVLDPAVGAGAFLIHICQGLAKRLMEQTQGLTWPQALSEVATKCVYGVDVNPLSVAVTELCLWLLAGSDSDLPARFSANLKHGDSLIGRPLERDSGETALALRLKALKTEGLAGGALNWGTTFPDCKGGFDVVVTNPPWVAYAGRSAQTLPAPLRKYYADTYAAWKGFPTLHGLFVERAAALAKNGTVALLLPSPVADLDGYRHVRTALTQTHRVTPDLIEFGQDAFSGVTQPCFALLAHATPEAVASPDPWPLSERQWANASAVRLEIPPVLSLLRKAPTLAPDHFGEMGFQTTRVASQTLLLRADAPDAKHTTALLEGRNVQEFSEGPAKLFLCSDADLLKKAKCRLRPAKDYQRVDFVVRQTASVPIAALHNGLAFRNSLLGGFGDERVSAKLLVALLNSSLYRALHLAGQRDARQAAFPQVKISHLRALPAPPVDRRVWRRLETLVDKLTTEGVTRKRRAALDAAVFELFSIPPDHQAAVLRFLHARAPRHAPDGKVADGAASSPLDAVQKAIEGAA